jgi:hypothetical protein
MKLKETNCDYFVFSTSSKELSCIISGLGHLSGGIATPTKEEYKVVIGDDIEVVRELRNRLKLIGAGNGADGSTKLLELLLSKNEIHTIVRAMVELANGVRILEWEFKTIVGHEREFVRKVLCSLHRLLVNRGQDLLNLKDLESL